jgi:hypothetical protein
MARSLTTHDTRFDDPDPATIAKVLASLDGGRNVVATLERSDVSYLQADGSVQTGFALGYQDGSIERRYRSAGAALPLDRVIDVFRAYARADAAWDSGVEWRHEPYVPPRTPWFSTWWGYTLALLAVAALIWYWRG